MGRVIDVSGAPIGRYRFQASLVLNEGLGFQIAAKRWRIDLNAAQQAALMLSAVNLPGGVQVS